jgi:hypothetical protein
MPYPPIKAHGRCILETEQIQFNDIARGIAQNTCRLISEQARQAVDTEMCPAAGHGELAA